MYVHGARVCTCIWTPSKVAVLWVCEVRGLKKPLKCYELYWSEIPQCIDYKPRQPRQAEDLKLDCSAISMGGILSFYFCLAFESLFCKCCLLLSMRRQCHHGTYAISAEEWQRTYRLKWHLGLALSQTRLLTPCGVSSVFKSVKSFKDVWSFRHCALNI